MKHTPSPKGRRPAEPKTPVALSPVALGKLSRLTVWLALIAPLADALVIFPLRQIFLANSTGASLFYSVFLYATELINLAAFFLLLALAVYCAIADSAKLVGRILAYHSIASVFIVILLKIGVYYALAWLDSFFILPFSLCNITFGMLTADSSEIINTALMLLIGQVVLFAILLVTSLIALRFRQKALLARVDLSPSALHEKYDSTPLPRALQLGLIVYAVLALANQILDTVGTVTKAGAPDGFDTLLSLIVPYFLLAIYCLLCYLVLDYGTRFIAKMGAE